MLLSKKVLVLNKSWVPVNITTVKRAICLVYSGLAKVVEPKTYEVFSWNRWIQRKAEEYILTVSVKIPVPEIIVLTNYNEVRTKRKVPFSRTNLLKRDDYTCQYCGKKDKGGKLTIDHVVPRSRGGTTHWKNCVIACSPCNKRKGNRLLKDVGYKLSRQPFAPTWAFQFDAWENEAWEAFTNGHKKTRKEAED